MMKINFEKIRQVIKQTKKRILVSLLILILVVVGLGLLIEKISGPVLENAIFYFKSEGKDSKLFYVKPSKELQHLITVSSEEEGSGTYKVPRHSYISHNGKILIYFEKTGQIPFELENKDFTIYRIIYEPKYVDLKSGSIRNIDQDIDAGSLVFSPDNKKIAWVLSAKESTIEELESAGKKREVWLSDPNGENAKILATLDEKVVVLKKWDNDYIYFRGVRGVGYYSLGRINIKTGRVSRIKPKFCSEDLSNCQNIEFSFSEDLFIYEAGLDKDGEKVIEMFIESFDGKKSWQILVKNYVSERLWMPDDNGIIYTEQENILNVGVREKIHLVNLKTKEDKEIYLGSYVSQIIPDVTGRYLYFMEKETDTKFNLVKLNIKDKKSEILESGEYNQMQIFSAN